MKIGTVVANEVGQYIEAELNNRAFEVVTEDEVWTAESAVFEEGELQLRLTNEADKTRGVILKLVVKSDEKLG